MKILSVIIPCKDEASIETSCLNSLQKQSFSEYEVIIEEGKNVCENRNRGAKKANGEYLFFLDSDIALAEDCFERMFLALEQDKTAGFAYGSFLKTGVLMGLQKALPWDYQRLCQQNYVSTMSMIRTSAFREVGGFREDLARFQDWELFLRIGKKYHGILVSGILFTAHYKEGGISTNKFNYLETFNRVKEIHNL